MGTAAGGWPAGAVGPRRDERRRDRDERVEVEGRRRRGEAPRLERGSAQRAPGWEIGFVTSRWRAPCSIRPSWAIGEAELLCFSWAGGVTRPKD